MHRREFLRKSALTLAASTAGAGINLRAEESKKGPSPEFDLNPDRVVNKDAMQPKGRRYAATVPDTLDLAERAKMAINNLTGTIEPYHFYYNYEGVTFTNPFQPQARSLTWNLTCENVFALPLLRTMSGSTQNLDVEYGAMRAFLKGMHSDGIIYCPAEDLGKPANSSFPDNVGFVGMAMMNWYERDGNRAWLDRLQMLVKGFSKMAVHVDDRAYFPPEYCYLADGTWYAEGRGKPLAPYNLGQEPTRDYQGFEGAVNYYQSSTMQSALGLYKYTRDENALGLATAISRFMLKPTLWKDLSNQGYPEQYEIGAWEGHFHGHMIPLWALLNIALVEDNEWLKQVVRRGYEQGLSYTVPGMGWSPQWLPAGSHGRPADQSYTCDNCDVADMVVLAIRLSDAGLGDYWDDADAFLRNQMIEAQFTDLERMRKFLGNNPENDKYLKRFLGGFFQTLPTAATNAVIKSKNPFMISCCSASSSWAMYYAWHAITRFEDGVATVNLLLNRASPWMDVDSYLPYEGKVVLHNKQAHSAVVRIPEWVDLAKLKCFVNGRTAQPACSGRRAWFQGLKPQDTIRLEFVVPEREDKMEIYGKQYTLAFRGSTIVDISPRDTDPAYYSIYQRDSMKAVQAPLATRERFVSEKLIPLL